jgi:hypothetical protein
MGAVLFSVTSAGGAPTSVDNSKRHPPTTGSVEPAKTVEERMKECMAIWDRRTHMTKQQWRRSCQTLLRYR